MALWPFIVPYQECLRTLEYRGVVQTYTTTNKTTALTFVTPRGHVSKKLLGC